MGRLFHTIRMWFSTKTPTVYPIKVYTSDSQYPIVIRCDYTHNFMEMIDWVNLNSADTVDVQFDNQYGQEAIYIKFKDPDDALIFRIRYSSNG